jgi:CheY-like chemotaxis protein
MIYGKDYVGPAFKVIVPEKEDNVEHICKNIFQAVKDHYAKLLILDLRLKGEEGSITDPKKISGIQVLEKLNEMHLPCPVLITTASNKIWTYKHSLSSGAIGFWTKEGLDDKYDTNASVDNYLSFIYLVHTLCYNENVKFLYETFLPRIVEIEEYQSVFWWETTFWQEADGNYTKIEAGNKEKIVSILLETFNIYRDLVRIRIVEGNKLALNQSQVTAIISSLHRIVEHIYAVVIKPYKKSPSISDIIKTLTPERDFRDILHIRNKAVHESNISDIELSEYISAILTILQNRRDEYFEEEDRYFAASIELEQIAESCTAGTTLDNLGEAKAYGNESKLLESTIEPEDGKEYQTIVSSYDENKPELIFLQNPGLNLKWCKVNILLLRSNIIEGKEDVCVGARVLFKLKINKKRENYYASYAKIIKTDKK